MKVHVLSVRPAETQMTARGTHFFGLFPRASARRLPSHVLVGQIDELPCRLEAGLGELRLLRTE